ncbi:hypothetical protein [Nitrosopumilus piranensis]|uniref:Uncharacterized protein n=1 Tax=Nitrosopumilus piranensis TaxID=1582439 RepID=A0A0C5C0U6_9ARCH|nr:hypothetical protein NPIRD3C_1743 [Nitrosopumilus piranensis]
MILDPLVRFKDAHSKGIIPDNVYDLTLKRFPITVAGINRIEKASGIRYPIAYVEPSLVLSTPNPNSYEYGILFARTIPVVFENKFQVVIQISAPLVAYGLKGTIHAILAHEFLHFLELIRKISKMELLSDEISGNLFENVYSDETRLFEPRVVFKDRTLLNHITKKFPAGFRDYKLEDKVTKFWINKNLPKINVSLDENTIKLPADALSKIKLDPAFVSRIEQLEEKSSKIRKKKLY